MSRFTSVLLVSPLADGQTWVLMRDFGYDVGRDGSADRIDVSVGFETDFASIPRLLWSVLPKWGRYGNAAVVHDWLYWRQERPRKAADDVLFEAMGVLDVAAATRIAIYWGVRSFGWIAWLRNQADRAAGYDRVLTDLSLKATATSQRRGLFAQLSRYGLRQVQRRLASLS